MSLLELSLFSVFATCVIGWMQYVFPALTQTTRESVGPLQ